MRISQRENNQLRNIKVEPSILFHADGSCLIKFDNTHIICSVTYETTVPAFLRGKNQGWLTAEYGMLPASTNQRMRRESTSGKQSGRTQEIQRLIGRSLRAAIDLEIMKEGQFIVDCDVINADGGTRTASITGSYIALCLAVKSLMTKRIITVNPIIKQVAAISCGIYKGQPIVDLDYLEDSNAEVDANFVLANDNKIIEIQSTAEKGTFSQEQFNSMLLLAQEAANQLFRLQEEIITNSN